uniref:CRAL-TRIO domain-containing protein n=1 Tax=Heterorhabditis bacteriophora TaxID=37862 RepID=A0A1I7WPV1_HETBA
MNSTDYKDILGHRLVPYLQRFPGLKSLVVLVHQIHDDNRQFETVRDLQFAISKVWSEVDKSIIKSLVSSMPERIFLVINRSGSWYFEHTSFKIRISRGKYAFCGSV